MDKNVDNYPHFLIIPERQVFSMFKGEYNHSIDAKGRLIVPANLREELGQSFVVTKGLDGCLFVYPSEEWKNIESKFSQIPLTTKDARKFSRFFFAGAASCEVDKQGRIFIPGQLKDFACIEKECIIIGVNDRLEIWSKKVYDNYFLANEKNISDIAEDLFSMED